LTQAEPIYSEHVGYQESKRTHYLTDQASFITLQESFGRGLIKAPERSINMVNFGHHAIARLSKLQYGQQKMAMVRHRCGQEIRMYIFKLLQYPSQHVQAHCLGTMQAMHASHLLPMSRPAPAIF
jgi:hypothetical protein